MLTLHMLNDMLNDTLNTNINDGVMKISLFEPETSMLPCQHGGTANKFVFQLCSDIHSVY